MRNAARVWVGAGLLGLGVGVGTPAEACHKCGEHGGHLLCGHGRLPDRARVAGRRRRRRRWFRSKSRRIRR